MPESQYSPNGLNFGKRLQNPATYHYEKYD